MSDYTPPTLVTPTPGGSPGDGSINGALTIEAKANSFTLSSDSTGNYQIKSSVNGPITFTPYDKNNNPQTIVADQLNIGGGPNMILNDNAIARFNNINTVGFGVSPIYGKDKRTGLTAADASATTLYTTTAADQLYRLMGRILATAGTSPSATYTIKWTEGGVVITKTLTISALDSDSDLSILIQPDNGTAITAQLTAISGTGTTVNVAATVEQMA